MAITTIWRLAYAYEGEQIEMLFTSRDLAISSIKLSYSTLPNVVFTDKGNTYLVELENGKKRGFSIAQIVNGEVHTQVEHL